MRWQTSGNSELDDDYAWISIGKDGCDSSFFRLEFKIFEEEAGRIGGRCNLSHEDGDWNDIQLREEYAPTVDACRELCEKHLLNVFELVSSVLGVK